MGSKKRSKPFQSRWKPALNTFEIAATRARKLPADVVVELRATMARSIETLGQEDGSALAWKDLCVACVMARRIEVHGVVKGLGPLIGDAMRVLNDVHGRSLIDGNWRFSPLSVDELDVLREMVEMHGFQLEQLSVGEFEQVLTAARSEIAAMGGGGVALASTA